jgi:hypothetical protein
MIKKVTQLIGITISKSERGLWYDHDVREYDEKGWGIVLKLHFGKMIRPIPKFWKKDQNPWRGDKPWFVIRIPWMVGPFFSIAVRKFGLYFGFKTFEVTDKHRSDDRYGRWMKEDEFGTDDKPAEYLQLSATVRRTRWK